MANYEGAARSNYFKVKDPAAFQLFCRRWGLELIEQTDREKELPAEGRYGWLSTAGDGIPDQRYDDEAEELDESADFEAELAAELADGEVAIAVEVGREKMRYLYAISWALDNTGRRVEVELDQALRKAIAETWPDQEVTRPEF